VDARVLQPAEEFERERRLQQRFASGDRRAALAQIGAAPLDARDNILDADPPPAFGIPGVRVWQYRQRNGQPWRNTMNRSPGPSSVPKLSKECTLPITSIMSAIIA